MIIYDNYEEIEKSVVCELTLNATFLTIVVLFCFVFESVFGFFLCFK